MFSARPGCIQSIDILPQLTQWDSSRCAVRLCFNGVAGWPVLHSSTVDDAPPTQIVYQAGIPNWASPHLFDVDSCVHIPVQNGVAALAFPAALLECKVCIDSSAYMASLAGRHPPVDFHDGGASVADDPFQNRHEFCKSEVGNLPPPQALHPIKVKVFDADDSILAYKLVGQLEEPIAPAIADALVDALPTAG